MSSANNLTYPVPSKVTVTKIGDTTVTTGVAIGTEMPIDAGDGYPHEAPNGTPGQLVEERLLNGTDIKRWVNP